MSQFKVSKKQGKEFISFKDKELIESLKKIVVNNELFSEEDISIELQELRCFWRVILLKSEQETVLKELSDLLQTKFKKEITIYNNLIESKMVSYEDTPNLFIPGHFFKIKTKEDYYAVEITEIERNECDDRSSYSVRYRYINYIDCLDYATCNFYISMSKTPITFENLPATPLTDFEKDIMQKRGLRALEYMANKFVFCNLKGSMKVRCSLVNCSGRVIVDNKLFYQRDDDEPLQCKEEIEEEIAEPLDFSQKEFLIYPFVGVYSLEKKTWGLAHVDKLYKIDFYESAFDNVVMDFKRKEIIRKIVTTYSNKSRFDDFVTNKNGGLIFLLHGLPGLGKTLIAESTAEFLKAPLLQITAGELGIYPDEIEDSLRNKFSVAKRWNAIVLIDEADVFMEQRSSSDIKRNAMVTIFLRMLERFDGILFLTTNRGDNLDVAIKSRLSIILDYKPFTIEERYAVWKNLIKHQTVEFELTEEDMTDLSQIELNGREIKHLIKMSIALSDSNKITKEDITSLLKYVHVVNGKGNSAL